jgi:hypothetical protein
MANKTDRPEIMNAGTNYMLASEVVTLLQSLMSEHGDQPVAVVNYDGYALGYPFKATFEDGLFIFDEA